MPSNTYNKFKKALLKSTTPEHREEIMDLKFGCRVRSGKGIYIFVNKFDNSSIFLYENDLVALNTKSFIIDEILGRDLTIEDVLRALRSDYYINEDGYLYEIMSENEDGGIYLEMVSPGIYWQLGKPAHLQSEETLITLTKMLS